MSSIHNIEKIPDQFIDDPDFSSGLKTKFLSALGGSEKLYVNIDYVKPGCKSVKYHSHSHQEEFLLILKGTGTLRLNNEMMTVNKGDFFAKPAGKEIAHQFINSGEETLEILDCGTPHDDDKVFYPDEGVVLHKKSRVAFKGDTPLKGWSSDANH